MTKKLVILFCRLWGLAKMLKWMEDKKMVSGEIKVAVGSINLRTYLSREINQILLKWKSRVKLAI